MSNWKISEAKARLSEVVGACQEEPQVLFNRGKAVAALIGIDSFQAFERFRHELERPSMASLLGELDTLNREESDFGEAPQRMDRPPADID